MRVPSSQPIAGEAFAEELVVEHLSTGGLCVMPPAAFGASFARPPSSTVGCTRFLRIPGRSPVLRPQFEVADLRQRRYDYNDMAAQHVASRAPPQTQVPCQSSEHPGVLNLSPKAAYEIPTKF